MRLKSVLQVLPLLFILTSCETALPIVNNVDEREANEIIVYLARNGITSQKASSTAGEITPGVGATGTMWNILVPQDESVRAMALLNEVGLPRRVGTNLLELFAKTGLMSSDREETIRYQAGLAEELKNTIRKMDGVLDANVQISFSLEEPPPGEAAPKITAAVYVKHQGVLDNPNNHLETKIKRLVAGSIPNLDYDNVSVISDRSRFIVDGPESIGDAVSAMDMEKDYVKLWSITMSKNSISRFRTIFILMIIIILAFGGTLIWIAYQFYPKIFQKILKIKQVIPKKKKPE